MNILVKSCNVNHNWGDAAMLHATIQRFARIFDDCTVTLLEASSEFENEYEHLGLVSIRRPEYTSWTRERRIWDKLNAASPQSVDYLATSWPRLTNMIVRMKMKLLGRNLRPRDSFLDRFRDADALVVSGGGFITDVFPEPAENVLHLIMLAHQHDIPVFMFGQGIGPLRSWRLRSKARKALPQVQLIAAREQKRTVPLLQSLGVSPDRIHATGDDAIGSVPAGQPATPGDAIGVNLRVASYSKVSATLCEALASVLSAVASEYNAPLLPLPINYGRSDSDVDSIQEILAQAGVSSDGGRSMQSPGQVMRQAGACRVVVTGSYHGGVFALSQGVPVVSLSRSAYYDAKFEGLADMFGTGCTVLRTDRSDFQQALKEAIQAAWDSAPTVHSTLLESAGRQAQASQAAYNTMARYFGRK
jgi:colanic acid/amylovoran biosynthesis protein